MSGVPTGVSSCWDLVSSPSNWLKDCCSDTETFHVRVGGPSYSGKTSIVRFLTDTDVSAAAPVSSTDGLEISVTRFRQHLIYLYDSGSTEDDELSTAKFINFSSKAFDPRYPDGIVFVIDGNDRGRLPLAATLMHDFTDSYYKTSVLLILVAKCDSVTTSGYHHRQPHHLNCANDVSKTISPRRLCDTFVRPNSSAEIQTSVVTTGLETFADYMQIPTTDTHARNECLRMRTPVSKDSLNACTLREITRVMAHPSLMQKEWRIFFCSVRNGDGIDEAFEWFVNAMLNQKSAGRS